MTQPIKKKLIVKAPICSIKNCTNKCHVYGKKSDGTPRYRKVCGKHHFDKIVKNRGAKNMMDVLIQNAGLKTPVEYLNMVAKKAGFKDHADSLNARAKRAGFKNHTAYTNSIHPYRKHRGEYCENRDGRLGFKCRYKIRVSSQLHVDHKNGKPNDNRKINLQTLCANCHEYKSVMNGDKKTPGRKKLGVKY
jgi:hypothetical protein